MFYECTETYTKLPYFYMIFEIISLALLFHSLSFINRLSGFIYARDTIRIVWLEWSCTEKEYLQQDLRQGKDAMR